MFPMAGSGHPGQVHRTRMRHRQPRPSQARSGQEQRKSQNAALPEDTQHGANLACAALLRKREGSSGRVEGWLSRPHSEYPLSTRPDVGFRGPRATRLGLADQADEFRKAPKRVEPGIAGELGRTVVAASHDSL